MIISGQICGSELQRVFTLGDGCCLPKKDANMPSFWFGSGGTSECTLVPVFVPGEHPTNHPFGNPRLLGHLIDFWGHFAGDGKSHFPDFKTYFRGLGVSGLCSRSGGSQFLFFLVDSQLRTQLRKQPPQSSSQGNCFIRVRFGGVPSTVEVIRLWFCCLLA